MDNKIEPREKSTEIEIDFFRPDDASGVARVFRQVYGEGYPVDIYYRPERLIEENAAGRIISSVARTTTGEIVGHDAIVLLDSASRLYENAAGAVLPAFRSQGVFFRLLRHVIFNAAKRFGVEEILGEPVCNHVHLQKMCQQLGFTESGLEVDLMPASAYTREQDTHGRVSVLLGYFMHKPRHQIVYLPQVYRDPLAYLYAGLEVERSFEKAENHFPADSATRAGIDLFESAQVARTAIHLIGSDFETWVTRLEADVFKKNISVFHVWLPLTSPFAPVATDILRARGYFIGGVLPNWFGKDGLLMQKLTGPTRWEGIALYSERAKRIGEIVRNDWERVCT